MRHHFADFLDRDGGYWTMVPNRERYAHGIDDMPDPVQIDVGFASYKSHFENAGTTIKYTREYIVKDPLVNPEKFADLRRLEDHSGRDEFATVVLTKK